MTQKTPHKIQLIGMTMKPQTQDRTGKKKKTNPKPTKQQTTTKSINRSLTCRLRIS